jgi:hypothetical protein
MPSGMSYREARAFMLRLERKRPELHVEGAKTYLVVLPAAKSAEAP